MAKQDAAHEEKSLNRKQHEKEVRRLQAELCKLQDWVKYKGLRAIVIFEGRDAAGKGGTVRAIKERVSPRVLRYPAGDTVVKTIEYSQAGCFSNDTTTCSQYFSNDGRDDTRLPASAI
jgi:hypothetical protein